MKRAPLITAGALALALGGAATAAALGVWMPWADHYTQGVDVSAHQGPIDWRTLQNAGIRFAYIKATEGSDYVDPRFRANWEDTERVGLYRGAYHYFTLCRSGADQAANFLHTAPPRSAGTLPPAVDLEHKGPCRHGPTTTDVVGELRAYLDAVEAGYGARPILYTTREFHDAHLADFPRERFWIRSLYTPPDFRRAEWVFWQHHNMARRPGVNGPVDLDAFRGDERALRALTQSSTS
ncbi:MAG: GH25 family lysozyme [Pseudomonadota bacterium]